MLIEMLFVPMLFRPQPLPFHRTNSENDAFFGSLRFGFVALRRFACAP